MLGNSIKKCFFLIPLLMVLLCAKAQLNTTASVSYIDVNKGLSNNSASAIYQDRKGFMWIGTFDGLNRYDGYGFKSFRNNVNDSNSLVKNRIRAIAGDADDNLWVGTINGLSIYNPRTGNFTTPSYMPFETKEPRKITQNIRSIVGDAYGNKFIGTVDSGLLLFEKGSRIAIEPPLLENNKLVVNRRSIFSMYTDHANNKVWVFLNSFGLCTYDYSIKRLKLVKRFNKIVYSMVKAKDNSFWLGTNDGLYRYEMTTHAIVPVDIGAVSEVFTLLIDKEGILWIGTDGNGLFYKQPSSDAILPFLSPDKTQLVNSNSIYSLYEDKEGRKWVGTGKGGINLFAFKKDPFTTVVGKEVGPANMPKRYILSFSADTAQNIWIGTDGGLRYWDRKQDLFTDFEKAPRISTEPNHNNITRVLHDHTGKLWVANWLTGFSSFNKTDHTFKQYNLSTPFTKKVQKNAWLLYEDRQKKLWAGTLNGGHLFTLNRKTDQFELFDTTFADLVTMTQDDKGTLWGGNFYSLFKIDTLHKKHVEYRIGFPVRAIHEDKLRNFWVGTEGGGLLLFDRATGKYRRFTTDNGLPNNAILNILEDGKGNLWLSTYNGLSKFNIVNKTCNNYAQSDGLQSNQFNYNAALALNTGEFLFGGVNGFNIFYPDSVYGKPLGRPVLLDGITIGNTPIEKNSSYVTSEVSDDIKEIKVPYSQAVVSFDFVTIDYSAPDKIQYAYFLEGWDKHWNYIGNARKANYSRLEPGHYTFRVKSTNGVGGWANPETKLSVIILPPWYKTWWAYLLYALAACGAIYMYLRYTKKQAHLGYEVRLAKIETEKERELNEKKLSFFTNVSHEFRTPLTLIINPINQLLEKQGTQYASAELTVVRRNARRLLSLTNQLLLFRKADSGADDLKVTKADLNRLVNEVFECFTQEAAARQINYELTGTQHHLEIYADVEKLEIALFNLVSNAFKFTPDGGAVSISIINQNTTVDIVVADTGSGVAAGTGNQIFEKFRQATNKTQKSGFGIGLYLVRNFIEKHGGKIGYESEPGKGTRFIIGLQKGNAHFDASAIFEEAAGKPEMLREMVEEPDLPTVPTGEEIEQSQHAKVVAVTAKKSVLVVEDNDEIRNYLKKIFGELYTVYEATNGHEAYKQTQKKQPDIVISDINMDGMDGMEFCKKIKTDEHLSHIPIILLTGANSSEMQLKGIENGADDYITKPFETGLLLARVSNILKRQNNLRRYFFDSITLKENTVKVPAEYQDFLNRCIEIVEANLDNDEFSIKTFCKAIGMSHSNLYVKVKQISGQTVNSFIRSIRLRRAAVLMLKEDTKIAQIAFQVGIGDIKYFREQFNKLFGMNPSDYVKRYKGTFANEYNVVKGDE